MNAGSWPWGALRGTVGRWCDAGLDRADSGRGSGIGVVSSVGVVVPWDRVPIGAGSWLGGWEGWG